MTPTAGYAIADIATLRGITAENRSDGYSLLVKITPSGPSWYTYIESSEVTANDIDRILPNDAPNNGRWIKSNAPANSLEVSSGVGNFTNARSEQKIVAGLLDVNSAFKIAFPDNTSIFMSTWAFTFRSPGQAWDVNMRLSGHYTGFNFNHFENSYLLYNWSGFHPDTFGINWYYGVKWGDNLDLELSAADKLNLGIYHSGSTRELHIYNRTTVSTHFVANFTYSFDV